MRIESGIIEGDSQVTSPLTLNGVAKGSLTVAANAVLHLNGVCLGSVTVEPGGIAMVHGIIEKNLVTSGIVDLRGIVKGDLTVKQGHFQRSPGASVRGTVSLY